MPRHPEPHPGYPSVPLNENVVAILNTALNPNRTLEQELALAVLRGEDHAINELLDRLIEARGGK